MSDLISRQDAIDAIKCDIVVTGKQNAELVAETIGNFVDAIKSLPSAEPKTGEWIQKDMYADRFCSKCNYAVWDSEAEEYNFCPNCGAKMLGEDGEA